MRAASDPLNNWNGAKQSSPSIDSGQAFGTD
jgi:hypothetical protein